VAAALIMAGLYALMESQNAVTEAHYQRDVRVKAAINAVQRSDHPPELKRRNQQ
jgi:hypothetical protein